MYQSSPHELVPIFWLLVLQRVLTDYYVFFSFMDNKAHDLSHNVLDHPLSQPQPFQAWPHCGLSPSRLKRLRLDFCPSLDFVIIRSWSFLGLDRTLVLVHSGTRPFHPDRFTPTLGPSPNRSWPDPRPLLDLIILNSRSNSDLVVLRPWSSLGHGQLRLCHLGGSRQKRTLGQRSCPWLSFNHKWIGPIRGDTL